jgi:hypothetical protein
MKYRFVVIGFLLTAAWTVCAAGEDREAKLAEIAAKYRDIVEYREVPGGKSLQDVFSWFAKVEPQGESGIYMRLMKARTQGVKVYTGERSWKKIGAGNAVNIRSGEKKCIWVLGISLDIGLDNAIFAVDDCPWLSNSVHTVYVRMRESSEFHNTVKVDSYIISIDQKRAYYREGKREVAYPFPFTNPEPDMTQEELEKRIETEDLLEVIEDLQRRLANTFGPSFSQKRYSQIVNDGKYEAIEYVVFEDGDKVLFYIEFFPSRGNEPASVTLWNLDFRKEIHISCVLSADGTIEDFDVIKNGLFQKGPVKAFKRNFVKTMLKRLDLTAADLPGIDLEPVLGAGR